jgi:WD40 repeat protein
MKNPYWLKKCLHAVPFCLFTFLVCYFQPFSTTITAQSQRASGFTENLHGLLLRRPLQTPVHGKWHRLQFSPDGNYLLVQGFSGFGVFSASSLKPILLVSTENIYPVRFSQDSQTVIVVSYALRTARWRLPEGKRIAQDELPVPGGCLTGELSPGGEYFACYRSDLSIRVYDAASGKEVLGDKPEQNGMYAMVVPISILTDNLDARPIGFRGVNSYESMANRGMRMQMLAFSPDGENLIVANALGATLWNIPSRQKTSLPSSFKAPSTDVLCFLDDDRVLSYGKSKPSEILSVKTHKLLSKLSITPTLASRASDPKYLLVEDQKVPRIFEVDSGQFLDIPDSMAMDIRNGILANVSKQNVLSLTRVKEKAVFASSSLPPEPLPSQLFAAASPDLDILSLGFNGNSALFRTQTGERISAFEDSSESTAPDSTSAFYRTGLSAPDTQHILKVNAADGTSATAWNAQKLGVRLTPAVAFVYSFEESMRKNVPVVFSGGGIPYELEGRELGAGKELWKKTFHSAQAVPFPDPQGKRIVLGWEAKTDGAHEAARRCPAVSESFHNAKLNPKDTFFEVLDASNGKTLGGALVQFGAGPDTFDYAFSAGSSLVISKDEGRLALYSLKDGQEKSHLNGLFPAASEESGLLALAENGTQLVLHDLNNGAKLDQQQFPDMIAYVHFSQDGHRLLVVTRNQTVYILDVAGVLKAQAGLLKVN